MESDPPRDPPLLGPDARAWLDSGRRLLDAGQHAEAVALLQKALDASPDHPAILEPLAEAYRAGGQLLPALRAYDRLIDLGAATAKTWLATGNALVEVGEYAQAVGAFRQGLALDPRQPEAHHNLARALFRLGDVAAAVAELEICTAQCDELQPWLSLATIVPGSPAADNGRILHARSLYGRRLAASTEQGGARLPRTPRRPQGGPLRVGYVSAYFHKPNYMKPVWGLLNHHDRSAVEIHLFSDSPPGDGLPGYRPHPTDRVLDTSRLDNGELAALVADCRLDVLVDLNAYSVPERLALFARPLAPVTLAWFNMYATSGLPGIDFLVGDDEVVPAHEEPFYGERVLRLPVSYLTFQVDHAAPPVADPPCIRGGGFTFGSLVSQYKITAPVLDAWAAILRAVPHARLVLANADLKSPMNRQYVHDAIERRGVERGRVELRGPAAHPEFLAYYDDIDVALDAFPYNGGTTTMEALWQGVPVLAPAGDRWAARTSQTLLRRCGLGEFVAAGVEDYVARAVRLAQDRQTPGRLREMRRAMRGVLSSSSACDTPALARGMEALFRRVQGSATA